MTTFHMLTVRTNAAMGRLATLQRRAEKVTPSTAPIVKTALKELSEALEELRIVNEQLQHHAEETVELKRRVEQEQARRREFIDALPMACVWTSFDGQIEEANSAAANLLNVSTPHLSGRPLMLFMTERMKFNDSLMALKDGLTTVVELPAVLRPRERRARPVWLVGRRLENDSRCCWFILDGSADARMDSSSSPAA